MVVHDVVQTEELIVGGTFITAGRTGRPAFFQAITNVKMGGWFNASKSYMDCAETGTVTGLMSAHNMELRLPNSAIQTGNYTCAEHNLVFQAGTTITHGRIVALATYNVSGDQSAIDAWEDSANTKSGVLEFNGLTSGAGDLFDATGGPAGADAALAIIVNGTRYWLSLSTST